jgi:hypothetical protein
MIWQSAIVRSLYGGAVTGAASAVAVYATTNNVKAAALSGAGVFLSYLITRGLAEGLIDNSTATVPTPPSVRP